MRIPELKTNILLNKLTNLLFYFCLFIFIVAFAFPHNPAGNWEQQFLPNLGGQQIRDIIFLDSLTGYAVSSRNVNPDTSSILKTTNGGDNWQIIFTQTPKRFSRIQFINQNTGFVCGGSGGGTAQLYKTTNAGANWTLLSSFGCAFWSDIHVLSNDTIWLVDSDGLCGGVFRTTNGGASWQNQLFLGNSNPNHVYFYNGRLGFICEDNIYLRRTNDGGASWGVITGENGFTDMYFIDSLTGWKARGNMKKTTDGGLNWVSQIIPSGGNIILSQIIKFDNIINDTIWGVGSTIITGVGNRGMILRTTNSGNNWLFQVPDSNINIFQYQHIQFTDKMKGWAYWSSGGVHTTNGGDTTWYIGIQQISSEVPKDFILKQNYPNPFNPRTVIPFSLKKSAYVKLIAYDITGREVQKMVDSKLQAGEYEVDFMGKFTSSGVYLYRMEVIDEKSKQLFTETKKMILIK